MLTFGGAGLLMAGIIMMLFPHKIIKDPEKAANAKKQAPILALAGAAMLALAIYLGGFIG